MAAVVWIDELCSVSCRGVVAGGEGCCYCCSRAKDDDAARTRMPRNGEIRGKERCEQELRSAGGAIGSIRLERRG